MIEKKITGTIFLMKNGTSDCACCDGNHVIYSGITLDEFESNYPSSFDKDLTNWLHSNFNYKDLDGKRIEITATILEN